MASKSEELSELGRKLAAARRTDVEGVCPICGRTFVGPAKQKYDRPGCAVTASRRRKRELERQKQHQEQ